MGKIEYKIETVEVENFTRHSKKNQVTNKINIWASYGWRLSHVETIVSDKLLRMGNSATTHFVLFFEKESET